MEKIHASYSLYFIFLSCHKNAMHPGLSANTSQLPFDIVIGRKDIVLQSLKNLFENLDIVATQITFCGIITTCASIKLRHSSHWNLKLPRAALSTAVRVVFGAELGGIYRESPKDN
jgi:hypothetical protein